MFKEVVRQVLYIPIINLMIFLIWLLPNHNAGLAIIILTIIIRIILLIPSHKAIISQQKMRDIQPKVDEIKKLYPNNRQQQSIAQMELYKKEKINMFGSCLPTLIQLPVLIALYYAFKNGLDPSRHSLIYSFAPYPDFIDKTFFGIDLTLPDKTYILPILAGIFQFIQTKMMLPKFDKNNKPDASTAMQQNMTYMFPVMTVLISRNFAAALPLYWAISSIFSTIQQYLIVKKSKNNQTSSVLSSVETNSGLSKPTHEKPMTGDRLNIKPIQELSESKHGVEITIRKKP